MIRRANKSWHFVLRDGLGLLSTASNILLPWLAEGLPEVSWVDLIASLWNQKGAKKLQTIGIYQTYNGRLTNYWRFKSCFSSPFWLVVRIVSCSQKRSLSLVCWYRHIAQGGGRREASGNIKCKSTSSTFCPLARPPPTHTTGAAAFMLSL